MKLRGGSVAKKPAKAGNSGSVSAGSHRERNARMDPKLLSFVHRTFRSERPKESREETEERAKDPMGKEEILDEIPDDWMNKSFCAVDYPGYSLQELVGEELI